MMRRLRKTKDDWRLVRRKCGFGELVGEWLERRFRFAKILQCMCVSGGGDGVSVVYVCGPRSVCLSVCLFVSICFMSLYVCT